ncbi:(2Fe-2S)-binding protein [Granulosicoccus sp.]|nr:(2Fe-2S)-binding protein [Granulosicoccus sp.]
MRGSSHEMVFTFQLCRNLNRWLRKGGAVDRRNGNRVLLAAGRPGQDQPDKGAIVCSCFGVGAKEIVSAINNGCDTVASVGLSCKAGTNCGSCQCEISGFIAKRQTA